MAVGTRVVHDPSAIRVVAVMTIQQMLRVFALTAALVQRLKLHSYDRDLTEAEMHIKVAQRYYEYLTMGT